MIKSLLSFLDLNKKTQQNVFNFWSEIFREMHFCYYFCGPHFYFEIKVQMTQSEDSKLASLKPGDMASRKRF